METQYNLKSPAVKRLMKEAKELSDPSEQYYAQPLEENLFEWHFTIRGPADSEFEGGIYHGRIILPPEYPMKPPAIMLLTANGRFELHKKICLSISGHHPESWQPSWSIRTALLAIIGFMPTPGNGAIGALDYTAEERQILAKKSVSYKCDVCGHIQGKLLPLTAASSAAIKEAKELAQQIHIEGEKPKEQRLMPESPIAGSVPTAAGAQDELNPGSSIPSSSGSTEQYTPADQSGVRHRVSGHTRTAEAANSDEPVARAPTRSCASLCTAWLMTVLITAIAGLLCFRAISMFIRK